MWPQTQEYQQPPEEEASDSGQSWQQISDLLSSAAGSEHISVVRNDIMSGILLQHSQETNRARESTKSYFYM